MVPFDAYEGSESRQGWFTREPLGLILAITPYNDPLNLVAHKVAPAIAAGCPFCNLHFHSIEKLKELYKKNDVVLISVYESSAENLTDMIADQSFYSIMVPDSQSKLYTQFSLERSLLGLFKYMLLGGGLADAMKGMQLFKKKVKLDGHTDRKEAEFLIDANGQVALAHYASAPGDLLPIATVQQFITA